MNSTTPTAGDRRRANLDTALAHASQGVGRDLEFDEELARRIAPRRAASQKLGCARWWRSPPRWHQATKCHDHV